MRAPTSRRWSRASLRRPEPRRILRRPCASTRRTPPLDPIPKSRLPAWRGCAHGVPSGAAVHLSYAGPDQGLRRWQEGAGERPSPVLPGRQDRRAWPQRLGQIDTAAHHGRHRQGVRRRGVAGRGRHRRLPAAGAAARCDQGRRRQRHGRRRRQEGDPRPLQRTDDELLRRDRRRGDQAPGADRRAEPLGPRFPVEQAMDALGCPPNDSPIENLSGGEKRRVALCQLLLRQPDLLLLDEPTNHLDAETVQWLEKHLREYPGAILIVTHDRYFLDNVTGWILELDRGRSIPYEGKLLGVSLRQGQAHGAGGPRGSRPRTCPQCRARMDRGITARPPDEIQGAYPRLRRAAQAQRGARSGHRADHHPARRAPRRQTSSTSKTSRRATATRCSSRISPSSCRPAASSASSARTAPARRRCFA